MSISPGFLSFFGGVEGGHQSSEVLFGVVGGY